MAATALAVGHKITIGQATYSTTDHTRLTALRVQSALDVPVNAARIALAPPDGLNAEPDDDVAIELGYDDQLELVFTGKVDQVEARFDELVVYAAGSFRKLLAARFNLLYEKSKAGDVVSDLAGRLDVSTGSVEDGPEYPFLALSGSETAYGGLQRLAERCGFDLYADAEDRLVFARYAAAETVDLQFGVNVLSVQVENRNPLVKGAAVYGESPASLGQGSDAASWLTKKEVSGKAGDSGGLALELFDATARTQDMAAQAAQAVLAAVGKRRCTLRALGAPAAQLGGAVKVSGMPSDAQNGRFKLIGVEHRLDRRRGFISIMRGLEV